MHYLVSFIIGFCFGIIPFSYIIGRIKGIDLKQIGSGNIGATNLGRAFGVHYFLAGFILDGVKGFIPVVLAHSLLLSAAFAGLGAILGHIFNPFFGCKGGKGVSTTVGVALGLIPKSFLISIIAWIVAYLTTYIVSLASMSLACILPIVVFVLHEGQLLDRILMLFVSLVVIYAHRANLRRLLKHEEPRTILWKKK